MYCSYIWTLFVIPLIPMVSLPEYMSRMKTAMQWTVGSLDDLQECLDIVPEVLGNL